MGNMDKERLSAFTDAVTTKWGVMICRRWNYEMYDTKGSELVPELKVVSENVFEKSKASALTSEEFTDFIKKNDIEEFYLIGADATACVKSTSYNLVKEGYKAHVISDCITSYDLKKLDEMFAYYADKGCEVLTLVPLTLSAAF